MHRIRDLGAESIANSLRGNLNLKSLNLSRNYIQTDYFWESLKQ
jgi:hypothetical protein